MDNQYLPSGENVFTPLSYSLLVRYISGLLLADAVLLRLSSWRSSGCCGLLQQKYSPPCRERSVAYGIREVWGAVVTTLLLRAMRHSSTGGNRQSHGVGNGTQGGRTGNQSFGYGGKQATLEPLKPSTYSSQSLSLSSSASAPSRDGWNTSCPVYEKIRPEYNAITDPYCPYTRTKQFKQHHIKQLKLEKLPPEQMSKSLSLDLKTGFIMTNSTQEMKRPTSTPDNQFLFGSKTLPMPTMTISDEPTENVIQSETELEVLKAILSREGYLKRLANLVKRLEKKFKPEIADILDLLRIASVNVVEAIVEWKKVKKVSLSHP
jgi:hypothetical protein